jgi:hypothetical protein
MVSFPLNFDNILYSNNELLRCTKSDVRNDKDVVSFTLSFVILM